MNHYDTTVLQSKTVANIIDIVEELITIAKQNTRLGKDIVKRANLLIEKHDIATRKIDQRTTLKRMEESRELEKWLNKTFKE